MAAHFADVHNYALRALVGASNERDWALARKQCLAYLSAGVPVEHTGIPTAAALAFSVYRWTDERASEIEKLLGQYVQHGLVRLDQPLSVLPQCILWRDTDGLMPLHAAVRERNLPGVLAMLRAGALQWTDLRKWNRTFDLPRVCTAQDAFEQCVRNAWPDLPEVHSQVISAVMEHELAGFTTVEPASTPRPRRARAL